jgi:hypothetical protein
MRPVILLISIYITIRVAGRVYASALVRGGARVSWSAALRLRPSGEASDAGLART